MGTSGGSFLQAPGLMKPHSLSGLSSLRNLGRGTHLSCFLLGLLGAVAFGCVLDAVSAGQLQREGLVWSGGPSRAEAVVA